MYTHSCSKPYEVGLEGSFCVENVPNPSIGLVAIVYVPKEEGSVGEIRLIKEMLLKAKDERLDSMATFHYSPGQRHVL